MIARRGVLVAAGAGLACGLSHAQPAEVFSVSLDGSRSIRPLSAQPILGVRMDGTLVLGETVNYPTAASARTARGGFTVPVYDALVVGPDTDGDGLGELACGDMCGPFFDPLPSTRWFFGTTFAMQAFVDDAGFNASAVAVNPSLSGFRLESSVVTCDGLGGEPLVVLFSLFDTPDLAGYDTDGDGGVDNPYPRTDADGDGLVDEFTGGAVVTFADTDTNGDGAPDVLSSSIKLTLNAVGLTDVDGDGNPGDPGAPDFGGFPQTDSDGDGKPDGAIEVYYTRGLGPDTDGDGEPDGPIYGSYVPSTLALPFIWGTADADATACAGGVGVVDSTSGGVLWGQGQNTCDPSDPINRGWSDGASDGGLVNGFWDPAIDMQDLSGLVTCPNPISAAIYIEGEPDIACFFVCADTNEDGRVTPADFSAWIQAYNSGSPRCDQNGDAVCTPSDFNSWILNFNLGSFGPVCPC